MVAWWVVSWIWELWIRLLVIHLTEWTHNNNISLVWELVWQFYVTMQQIIPTYSWSCVWEILRQIPTQTYSKPYIYYDRNHFSWLNFPQKDFAFPPVWSEASLMDHFKDSRGYVTVINIPNWNKGVREKTFEQRKHNLSTHTSFVCARHVKMASTIKDTFKKRIGWPLNLTLPLYTAHIPLFYHLMCSNSRGKIGA